MRLISILQWSRRRISEANEISHGGALVVRVCLIKDQWHLEFAWATTPIVLALFYPSTFPYNCTCSTLPTSTASPRSSKQVPRPNLDLYSRKKASIVNNVLRNQTPALCFRARKCQTSVDNQEVPDNRGIHYRNNHIRNSSLHSGIQCIG